MSEVTNKRALRDTVIMVLIIALLFGGGFMIMEHLGW